MKTKELLKVMQSDFDNGERLSDLYNKYKNDEISEKRLSTLLGNLKDKNLIKKHKTVNKVLIFVMCILTLFSVVIGYSLGINSGSSSPIYWTLIAILPAMFTYGFIRNNQGAYLGYILLSLTQLPKSFVGFGDNPIADVLGVAISISVIALVWYVKSKLFPYMGFIGPKKDKNKKYAVQAYS